MADVVFSSPEKRDKGIVIQKRHAALMGRTYDQNNISQRFGCFVAVLNQSLPLKMRLQ
jgi:hypothetical protein